jgi:cytochrome P450
MVTTALRGFVERSLLDPETNANPYPYLAALREHAPVYWSRVHDSWLITGYHEVIDCFQPKGTTADRVSPILNNVSTQDEDLRRSFAILSKWMAFNDASDHRRLRSVFGDIFHRLQVQQYQPLIRRIVEQQLVQLREKGGHCDIVTDYAQPISMTLFSQFLGVSPADVDGFRDCTRRVADIILGMPLSAKKYREAHHSLIKLFHYLLSIIKQRQLSPGDDLISTVLERGLGDVSVEEFAAMLTQIAYAGFETTCNLMTNGIRVLLQNREQLKILQDEPQHWETGIDECVRFDGHLKLMVRWANSDFELRDQTIKARTRLYLMTAAANRDPAQFDHPNVLEIRRNPNAHLGFGHGPHACLGAALGRLLNREAISSLFQEYPNLTLDGDTHEWRLSFMVRSVTALPVQLRK